LFSASATRTIFVSKAVLTCINSGFEEYDYDSLRPYFRPLTRLLLLQDTQQAKRVEVFLPLFLQTIKTQANYWKITDFCLEHLIRLVKKCPDVYNWLQPRGDIIDPLLSWINAHLEPPSSSLGRHDAREQPSIQLLKPGQQYWPQGQQQMNAYSYCGLPPRLKAAFFESVKQGKIETENASDSDVDFSDRVLIVGQWVDCCDTSNNWLCAQVVRVEGGNKAEIRYDGWSEKWNEVLDMAHPRIRALGTCTTKEALENRGKPRKGAQN